MVETKLEGLNQRELRKLMLSIRASAERLDLLLAICDDRNLQAQLIHTYETELRQQGITPYQIRLDNRQPSLRATLADLVERTPTLQTGERAVVTVLGGNELLGVKLTDTPSEQDQFFFSLQWTREALRGFHFPIVLWLSDRIATRLSQQAPDFWSWRSGVFEFVIQPQYIPNNLDQDQSQPQLLDAEPTIPTRPIADLTAEIAAIEQQNPQSPLLTTLYSNLGAAYEQRYDYDLALQSYERALKLAQTHKDRAAAAQTLHNIGNALYGCSRYLQAIAFFEQSLAICREISNFPEERQSQRNGEAIVLGNLGVVYNSLGQYQRAIAFTEQSLAISRELGNRNGEANALNNLGNIYHSLGQYQQAIGFYEESLAIDREIDDQNSEANALNNLGNIYHSLGQYQQAIAFYEESLAIQREIDNSPEENRSQRNGAANALGNLGNAYYSLEQYQQAIAFYEQSLAIDREIDDQNGEANALNNLGIVYHSLGQYQQAIAFHEQSLAIKREIGDRNGEAKSLGNLGNVYHSLKQYQQAIAFHEQSLAISREISTRHGEANTLNNLGNAWSSLGQYQQAITFYEQALTIRREMGDRKDEANLLQTLASLYLQTGRIREGWSAVIQAQKIWQELNLPFETFPYPNWMKQIVGFWQRGLGYRALFLVAGLVLFPLLLVWIMGLTAWRLVRARFHQSKKL